MVPAFTFGPVVRTTKSPVGNVRRVAGSTTQCAAVRITFGRTTVPVHWLCVPALVMRIRATYRSCPTGTALPPTIATTGPTATRNAITAIRRVVRTAWVIHAPPSQDRGTRRPVGHPAVERRSVLCGTQGADRKYCESVGSSGSTYAHGSIFWTNHTQHAVRAPAHRCVGARLPRQRPSQGR